MPTSKTRRHFLANQGLNSSSFYKKLIRVVLDKAIFVEDNKGILFPALHAEGCKGKNNLLPADRFDLITWQNKVAIGLIHRQLFSSLGHRTFVKI